MEDADTGSDVRLRSRERNQRNQERPPKKARKRVILRRRSKSPKSSRRQKHAHPSTSASTSPVTLKRRRRPHKQRECLRSASSSSEKKVSSKASSKASSNAKKQALYKQWFQQQQALQMTYLHQQWAACAMFWQNAHGGRMQAAGQNTASSHKQRLKRRRPRSQSSSSSSTDSDSSEEAHSAKEQVSAAIQSRSKQQDTVKADGNSLVAAVPTPAVLESGRSERLDNAPGEHGPTRRRRRFGWDKRPTTADGEIRGMAARLMAEASARLRSALASHSVNRWKSNVPPPSKLGDGVWEQPRSQTGLQLLGELCPPGVNWTYAFRDESRRSFAGYLPCPFGDDFCEAAFATVKACAEWSQPSGPNGPMPRKTAWMVARDCTCCYRYGGVAVAPQMFPDWMVQLMHTIMPFCALTRPEEFPNSCNLNFYEDGGMSVGWHSDDEELFQGRFRDCRIISLSLGTKRSFELRLNWPEEGETELLRLPLGNGDLCTMEGMVQKHLQHRVPREGHVSGARINLTWRWIVKHGATCPLRCVSAGHAVRH